MTCPKSHSQEVREPDWNSRQADSRVPALKQSPPLPHTHICPITQLSACKVQASRPTEGRRQVQRAQFSDSHGQTFQRRKACLRPHCHINNYSLGTHRTNPPTPPDPTGGFAPACVHFRSRATLTSYPAARAPGAATNNKKRKERGESGGCSARELVVDPDAPRPPPPARTPEGRASAAMAPQLPPPPPRPPQPPPGTSRARSGRANAPPPEPNLANGCWRGRG